MFDGCCFLRLLGGSHGGEEERGQTDRSHRRQGVFFLFLSFSWRVYVFSFRAVLFFFVYVYGMGIGAPPCGCRRPDRTRLALPREGHVSLAGAIIYVPVRPMAATSSDGSSGRRVKLLTGSSHWLATFLISRFVFSFTPCTCLRV